MTLPTTTSICPETPAAIADLPCENCPTGASLAAGSFDCRSFRDTLGRFATGVTVVTALSENGEPVGLTVSSFNSVSLNPPLILWSLSSNSPNLATFLNTTHYAVNVLAAEQQEISNRFAARTGDRFTGIELAQGTHGLPLIAGCCAWFECSNEMHHPGGDHLILIGRVQRFMQGNAISPLIFHAGRYCELQENSNED